MGQHTWFYKKKRNIRMTQLVVGKGTNFSEYHNLFRTTKRETDGEYCKDEINSYEEMVIWLFENRDTLYGEFRKQSLREFWKKYPEGCINFG